MKLSEKMAAVAADVEKILSIELACEDDDIKGIWDAMAYSACGGGKRIRPFLCVCVCEMLGGNTKVASIYATALEMIHTYSLIHDDLPCMDNDDLRRGKPTNHKVFGEAVATLAGDGLLTHAFSLLSHASFIKAEDIVNAISILTEAAGCDGMIGGQYMDILAENKEIDFETLQKLHFLKTGAMISAAVRLGMLAANENSIEKTSALMEYATSIGLAFQIIDDYLDAHGTTENLGKPVGSDKEENKTTFLSFLTPDQALQYAQNLTKRAIAAIQYFENADDLIEVAQNLMKRNK